MKRIRLLLILSMLFGIFSSALATGVNQAEAAGDVYTRLPFEGSVDNIGTSSVTPVVHGTLKPYSAGYSGNAINFDTDYTQVNASNPAPYVDLGNSDDLKFGADSDFSIAVWIKFPNTWKGVGSRLALISNKGTASEVGWQLMTDTYENLYWQMTVAGNSPMPEVNIGRITDTDWHHVAVSNDRQGYARFYLDGVEAVNKAVDLSAKSGTADSNLTPKIGVNGKGALTNPAGDKLLVSLDDLRIYRRALSAQQVADIREHVISLVVLERIGELAVGDTAQPHVYGMGANKVIEPMESGVAYGSSDPSIATIDADGTIHALALGQTTISASVDGTLDSFPLKVVAQPATPAWRSQLLDAHPRLMATSADFAALKLRIQNDPKSAAWFENVKRQAAAVLADTAYNGKSERVTLLGLMYNLTGDAAYADRAWQELQVLFGLPTWGPDSFLDLSERTMAASIAYDWFYNAWTDARHSELKAQLLEKGMLPGILSYRLGSNAPYATNYWLGSVNPDANNWNTVGNTGQLIAALALGGEEPNLAGEVIADGMTDIRASLDKFSPDGAWFEGYSYWNYTWIYLSRLLSSIDTALGPAHNPLAFLSGLSESGYFPIYLTGATQQAFNFGDSGTGIGDAEQMYYLANRYNKPEYTQYQLPFTEQAGSIDPLSLLWYNPAQAGGQAFTSLPLDKRYSEVEVGSMRQSWTDPDGVSVGFKAGAAQNGHMDLDAGSFVLDALGERWISDLGDRNRYDWPNFFSTYGPRWTYYTKRAEGHNTLVINPKPATGVDGDPDQTYIYNSDYHQFNSTIETLQSNADSSFSIMDLTKSYGDSRDAASVRRGIALLNGRKTMLLQDEITLNSQGEMYSFLHVDGKATVSVAADGQSATLTIGEKRLWIGLLEPSPGEAIALMDAKPLPTSPNPEIQYTKPGDVTDETPVQKLFVHLTHTKSARIALLFVPLQAGENPPSPEQLPSVTPLDDWQDSTAPSLSVQLDKTTIWPANHKMVAIHATVNASDSGSGIKSVVLTSITSDQPDSGQGDIQADVGTTATSFLLRAEKSRVYTITYTATDKAGNQTAVSVTVTVPHDQSGKD